MNHTETTGGPAAGRSRLLRPPLLFAAALASGTVLHLAWPLSFTSRAERWPIGGVLSAAGVVLFVAAVRAFNAAGTPVPGVRSTTAIVRRGP